MRILHIAPIRFSKISGLTSAIPPLINAQSKIKGIETALLLSNKKSTYNDKIDFKVFLLKDLGKNRSIKNLKGPFSNPDIVIFHSTYIPIHWYIARELVKKNIPYIIMPHGGMTIDSLHSTKLKYIKKRIVNHMFFNKFIKQSNKIHYLNSGEANRSNHWKKEYFILGNGIKMPGTKKIFTNNNKLIFSFIGRMDIKIKGLDLFLLAASKIKEKLIVKNTEIHFYGPVTNKEKKTLLSNIEKLNLENIVFLHGSVTGKEKEKILVNTDVFILTSRTEGHPMSVIEALSYGIPCLVTKGTNFYDEIIENNCGWGAKNTIESIKQQLINIIDENKSSIHKKGVCAKQFVENNLEINQMALESIYEYRKCL